MSKKTTKKAPKETAPEYKYDKAKNYAFHIGCSNDDFRNSQVFVIEAHTSKDACKQVLDKGFKQIRVLQRDDLQ